MMIWLGFVLLIVWICGGFGCGGDYSLSAQQTELTEATPGLAPVPHAPWQLYEKGCWLDDDCNDGIWCTGREWCCSPRGHSTWNCEIGKCQPGLSPCGQPISSVLAICDKEYDTCRGCYTDEECNVDTRYTSVNWDWCGGPRRCGGSDEGHHYGICLSAGSFPCEWYEDCDHEAQTCNPQPECRYDNDCGLEMWCDENSKCQEY